MATSKIPSAAPTNPYFSITIPEDYTNNVYDMHGYIKHGVVTLAINFRNLTSGQLIIEDLVPDNLIPLQSIAGIRQLAGVAKAQYQISVILQAVSGNLIVMTSGDTDNVGDNFYFVYPLND